MFVAAALMAAGLAGAAKADPVATSLPFPSTSDWTRGAMNPGNTYYDGSRTVLETSPGAGNWFGWGVWYANTPSWSPGSASAGNYLSFTAKVSADAADWHAYFYDPSGNHAQIELNPTFCVPGNCYTVPAQQGVALSFGGAGNAYNRMFVALDTTQEHTYELLVKDGVVSYRIDGAGYYGQAYNANIGAPLLVIGDSSGPSQSGVGSMTITSISFDNAPSFAQFDNVTPVPEPGEWAMMGAGLLVAGTVARRRKRG
jgi:hypothetical protein